MDQRIRMIAGTGIAGHLLLRVAWLCVLAGVLPLQGVSVPSPNLPGTGPGAYRPDRLLVEPDPASDHNALEALHRSLGARIESRLGDAGEVQVLEVPLGTDIPGWVERYQRSGLVLHAEPDYLLWADMTPNDPSFGNQWGLQNTGQTGGVPGADIDAVSAWNTLTSASNVIVAIIDSGVRYTHEDLAANLWVNPGEIAGNGLDDDGNGYVDDIHGINAIDRTGDPMDSSGHGTHVAGLVGAVGNNGKGITGVAWRVQLMALRFIDDAGKGATSNAIRSIDYARNHGAHIINASWGGGSYSSLMKSAIRRARDAGILFVTGAGNSGIDIDDRPVYPGSYDLDNIVVVAGTDSSDRLASYSNYGSASVHLAAPGSQLYSAYGWSDNAYAHQSGTSMSAPLVAGAFALMRARYPDETYRQLIDRVLAGVDRLPDLEGNTLSGGRLNLHQALGPSLVAAFSASPTAGEAPLTVAFMDESFGAVVSRTWDFGDGSPVGMAAEPIHTYDRVGVYTVTLEVNDSHQQASRVSQSIAVVPGYRMEPTTYGWIDPADTTLLPLADDGVSPAQALPFAFRLFGREHTHLYVGANGLIGFVDQELSSPNNTDLPHPDLPNAILCPYWDDLNPAAGGSIGIGTVGAAPNRQVVISWIDVRHQSMPPTSLTFQVVLCEGSNEIRFQYQEVRPDRAEGAGRRATVGIEDHTGQIAHRYSYLGSTLLGNGQAVRFLPPDTSPPPGQLLVHPPSSLAWVGFAGGPFAPAGLVWTLENTGQGPVDWIGTLAADWAGLSTSGGILEPAEELDVTAWLQPGAAALAPGEYRAAVAFTDGESGAIVPGGEILLSVHLIPELQIELESSGAGSIGLRFEGVPGWTCLIEGSTDLENWIVIGTFVSDEQGIVEVTGLEIDGSSEGYYRARLEP
jgi:subtilisin family serine protease